MNFWRKIKAQSGKEGIEVIIQPNITNQLEAMVFGTIQSKGGKILFARLTHDGNEPKIRVVAEFESKEIRDDVFNKIANICIETV